MKSMVRKTLAIPELEDIIPSVCRPRPRLHGSGLTDQEKVAVLWGKYRHWIARLITLKLGCGIDTVLRYRSKIKRDPAMVLRLPVIARDGKGYQCRFGGDLFLRREPAQRHFLDHVFPFEVARDVRIPKPCEE